MGNFNGDVEYFTISGGSLLIFDLDNTIPTWTPIISKSDLWDRYYRRTSRFGTIYTPNRNSSTQITGLDNNNKLWTLQLEFNGNDVITTLTIDGVGSVTNRSVNILSGITISSGSPLAVFLTKRVADDVTYIALVISNNWIATSSYTGDGTFYDNITGATRTGMMPSGTTVSEFVSECLDKQNGYGLENWFSNGVRIIAVGSGNHTFGFLGAVALSTNMVNYVANNITPAPEVPDPYNPIPKSATGGAGGNFNFTTSDDIDYPSLPTLSAVSTGFISLWTPSETQMLKLAEYMWNADILTIEFWKKLFVNPLDLIYGLNLIPLDLSAISPSIIDSTQNVVMGLIDTKIAMDHLSTQWIEFDCGSITIDETWGAYLDYDPYTKLEIYLPYCGTHPLKVDDFMPGSISVKYHIDLLTGSCVAMVKSTKSNEHGDVLDSIVYQFMGNCATQVPVTAAQYSDAVRSAISIAASIGSMVAVGVGGAAAAGTAKTAGASTHVGMNTLSRELNLGASAVENVMNLKPSIERSGAIGSSGGMLAVQTPYLILTRPRQARPASQNVYTGYPSFITETLGDLKGWTIVQAIHLDNIPCTSEELDEIDGLLKVGVIF